MYFYKTLVNLTNQMCKFNKHDSLIYNILNKACAQQCSDYKTAYTKIAAHSVPGLKGADYHQDPGTRDRERPILYGCTYMEDLKQQKVEP